MLIRTDEYKQFILSKYDKAKDKKLIEEIFQLIEGHLKCNGECGRILPPEEFYNSSSFKNRGGKMPTCKQCHNVYVRSKK